MNSLDYELYYDFLTQHVLEPFYAKRLNALNKLTLGGMLHRKNPYLFKAKNIEFAGDLVKGVLDAFLSSAEETTFGNLLERFAIYVSSTLDGGFKSERKSVDLEFQRDDKYYIVGIKSGPHWGNSDQINIMTRNFKDAKLELRSQGYEDVVAVNGCMYGKDNGFKGFKSKSQERDPDRDYYKYCGQLFWHFLSGDELMYQKLIVPIDKEAKKKDDTFKALYATKVNQMTREFMDNFMTADQIDWIKLIGHVSRV
jgi:site-specific DNA-methyltransferase (cytosine-N4-specific)